MLHNFFQNFFHFFQMLEKDSNETLLASCSCCTGPECCELPTIAAIEKVKGQWQIFSTGILPGKRSSYINIPVLAVKKLLWTF